MDKYKETLDQLISSYFDENLPPFVNFLAYCEHHAEHLNFNRVLFYYVPASYRDGLPFVVLFFKDEENVTDRVASQKPISIMLSIFKRLPPVFSSEEVRKFPDWLDVGSHEIGLEEYIYEISVGKIRDIVERRQAKTPRIEAQIHDSDEVEHLNS